MDIRDLLGNKRDLGWIFVIVGLAIYFLFQFLNLPGLGFVIGNILAWTGILLWIASRDRGGSG